MALPVMTIEGNLVADPELRFTPGGHPVSNFRVACSERVRAQDGSWTDGDSLFVRVTAWGALGENVANSLHKGNPIIVIGRFKQHEYQDREGNNRITHELIASNVGPSMRRAEVNVRRNAPPQERPQQQQRRPQQDPFAQGSVDPWQSDEPPF